MKADRQKVRLTMERAHMTVHDVAKAAELPPQTAAAIICGMNVQPDTLARMAGRSQARLKRWKRRRCPRVR